MNIEGKSVAGFPRNSVTGLAAWLNSQLEIARILKAWLPEKEGVAEEPLLRAQVLLGRIEFDKERNLEDCLADLDRAVESGSLRPIESATAFMLNRTLRQLDDQNDDVGLFNRRGTKQAAEQIDRIVGHFLDYLTTTAPTGVELEKLIERVEKRRATLPLSSGITEPILGISKQLLAFGATMLPLGLAFLDKASALPSTARSALTLIGIFYFDLILTSLLVLTMYMLQARVRYPFLQFSTIGNAWPSFYYASIDSRTPYCEFHSANATVRSLKYYGRDLATFAERCLSEDKHKELRSALQQYFLLVSYQGYVNQFSLRLANAFMYCFIGSIVSVMVLVVIAWLRS